MKDSTENQIRASKDALDLQKHVGSEVYCSDWETITQQRINQFAQATGDFQWIHVDSEKAKSSSPYGDTVAHGFFTLSLLGKYYEDFLPVLLPYCDVGINYGLDKVRFTQAVVVGSDVRGRFVLKSISDNKSYIKLLFQAFIDIKGNEKPACVAESIVLRNYKT